VHWVAEDGLEKHTPAVVRLLVAAGADVNAEDGRGITPLAACQLVGRYSDAIVLVARALLAAGADASSGFWGHWTVRRLPRADRAALLGEAAWARRGHLCRLRRRVNPNSEQAAADEARAAAAAEAANAGAAAGAVANAGAVGTGGTVPPVGNGSDAAPELMRPDA
jgi:ankyrin repeat protein